MVFSRNPEKLEAKALEYERKGNTRKAIKNREKAARIRSKHAGPGGFSSGPAMTVTPLTTGATSIGQPFMGQTTMTSVNTIPISTIPVSTIPITTTTTGLSEYDYVPRTPARYEQNALKWEQRGNWSKAQKNREKVWRLQNPQYASHAAPQFYQNNSFVGYNVPSTGMPLSQGGFSSGMPLSSGFQRTSYFGTNNRDPLIYEQRAAEYERLGNQRKAMRYREKANMLRTNNGQYTSRRTQPDYERRALKWEQRGNWQKAQKNREKAWRLQNPQYMSTSWSAPMFYNNNTQFLGYNISGFQSQQINFNKGQQFYQQGVQLQGAPIVRTMTSAPTVETHVHNTIVEQTTRMEKITEIQPVIHREIDAPQLRIVEQHTYESVPRTGPATITRNAIVEETVKPRIIEEIQPVVHREVPQAFVERVEQHVTEHVVLPTQQSRQVVDSRAFSNMSLGQTRFALAQPGFSNFHQYSQFGRPQRDISLYEQRLAEYERMGNQKKAQRYREKIARMRSNGGQYQSSRTPADYERRATKWEQKGNFQKAQRNREKAWRLQNPQHMNFQNQAAPMFYNNNQFLGYNQQIPSSGTPLQNFNQFLGGQGLNQGLNQGLGGQGLNQGLGNRFSQFGQRTRDPSLYEQKAQEYDRRGKSAKANKLRNKANLIRQNNGNYSTQRTLPQYERNATKWEQKGNFQKAQKNREKAWRLQNPQYMALNNRAPQFYNNGKFLGYNQQIPSQQQGFQAGAPIQRI